MKANAYRFIKSFPKGFDTIVGERGQMLSGWFMNFNINSKNKNLKTCDKGDLKLC